MEEVKEIVFGQKPSSWVIYDAVYNSRGGFIEFS